MVHLRSLLFLLVADNLDLAVGGVEDIQRPRDVRSEAKLVAVAESKGYAGLEPVAVHGCPVERLCVGHANHLQGVSKRSKIYKWMK